MDLHPGDWSTPEIDPRAIQTRDDLARYLETSLPGDYVDTLGDDFFRARSTQVKSYLIEVQGESSELVQSRLLAVFDEVRPLKDRTILFCTAGGSAYFIDTSNQRFQVIHTVMRTSESDQVFRRLTEGSLIGYDHVWLPSMFLRAQQRASLTGFKFRFDTGIDGLLKVELNAETGEIAWDPVPRGSFNMAVSEDVHADVELNRLLAASIFEGRKALDQIQFRSKDEDQSTYIVNTIYSRGKIIGKGTSLGGHMLTVARALESYEQVVTGIEKDFAMGWVQQGGGLVHNGEPFDFVFPEGFFIQDVSDFAERLFSAGPPFRLAGIPHRLSSVRADVEAVDLHTGHPLSFEIGRNWIRVFLPIGSCGNIIARLFTNFQHFMLASVDLSVGEQGNPFMLRTEDGA